MSSYVVMLAGRCSFPVDKMSWHAKVKVRMRIKLSLDVDIYIYIYIYIYYMTKVSGSFVDGRVGIMILSHARGRKHKLQSFCQF